MKVIADYRMDEKCKAGLSKLGFDVIPTIPLECVYDEINGHADIQIHIVNNKAICAPEAYEYYKKQLLGIEVICGSMQLDRKYPSDIAYNVCGMGDTAICSKKHTAPEILKEYKNVINSRQGYAKCSICVVNDNTAITADEGICRILTENGMDVLRISPGYITLGNMTGFIGGASGLLKPGLLAFCGNIKTHPDHADIAAFCRNAGVDIVSLSSGELQDVGSMIAVR